MDISGVENINFKNKQFKQHHKLDVSFKDVIGEKFNRHFDASKIMPPDILNHTQFKSNKKRKTLLDVQNENLDYEESTLKTINDLKKTLKKLVAAERLFLDI
jgi:uncharacterized protein related to proFAR isomerase